MKHSEIFELFKESLNKIGISDFSGLFFEPPKSDEFGDLTTNIAFKLSKELKKSPKEIATEIISHISTENSTIASMNIAGAGFINLFLSDDYYFNKYNDLIDKGDDLGKSNIGENKKVNVEYVSANPTGLLHPGHGRNAAIGDSLANIFSWCGYDVTREYYFNNSGNQMNNLAKSIYARYMQQTVDKDFPFPEDGYHGEYIREIANELIEKYSNTLVENNEDNLSICRKFGEEWNFGKIKSTLEKLNVQHDVFYNEDSLYSEGKISNLLSELKEKELSYEKDGAVWMSFSKIGLKDDRVIVKSSGEPTYRLPDIAYHREKFRRGFDILIDIFGSDHIATIPDVLAGVSALGFDKDKVKVVIHQFVTLTENGQQVKMSKRSGKSYTLDELIEEVGEDVVRFFLIMRGVSTHLEFDLTLAKEQSNNNPVFYLQYAHARICSIIENLEKDSIRLKKDIKTELLTHKSELKLIKLLLKFTDLVQLACEKLEPMILADYLRDLASGFHSFYHDCRIMGVEEKLMYSRLSLANTTKIALFNGLSILGIKAPQRM